MTRFAALWGLVLFGVATALANPSTADAQPAVSASTGVVQPAPEPTIEEEPAPEYREGEILYLESGKRAPWTGLLIEQPDLVRWRLVIDNLKFRLLEDVKLANTKCDVRLDFEHQKQAIEKEGYLLKESMQRDRAKELAATIVELKKDVAEARKRGFLEQPIVWYVGGIASAVAIALVAK